MSASGGYPPVAVPVTVLSYHSTKFDMNLKHAAEPIQAAQTAPPLRRV